MAEPKDVAIEPARLAEALTAASGAPVAEDEIRADISCGAPVIAGQVPLLRYLGWLLKQREG